MREALHTCPSDAPGRSYHRGGITLVEMLIATAVTLLMMSAVLNLFANLGTSVRDRRALIEVDAQLRQVRALLARDLAGATCPATTWHNPGADEGYLEIVEGPYSDWNPSALVDGVGDPANFEELDYATSQVPSSQFFDPSTGAVTDGFGLGDYDDVLALTVRNDDEPFVGRYRGQTIESSLAEIIWFAEENNPIDEPEDGEPTDPANVVPGQQQQEGELGMRRIFRRVLIIAPWLGNLGGDVNDRPTTISAHWNGEDWIANSLGDLTMRENRFQHASVYDNNGRQIAYPHEFFVNQLDYAGPDPTDPQVSETEWLLLSDAVAFDVRVFDPGAPVFAAIDPSRITSNPNTAPVSFTPTVEPSDAGWGNLNVIPADARPALFGAYVDLGYRWFFDIASNDIRRRRDWTPAASDPIPIFEYLSSPGMLPKLAASTSPYPLPRYPAVYDTWSLHYEQDGLDQEVDNSTNNQFAPNVTGAEPWRGNAANPNVDQGTNGLDDDGRNGVDDVGERETAPPYDVELRAVKVILRVYERDARRVRATSVIHSFVE